MISQEELLSGLKRLVTEQSNVPRFVQYKWFVKYHLKVVDDIASELCAIYKKADGFKVAVLVWLHDYEKIVDYDNQYNTELAATKELMKQVGFEEDFIADMCRDINIYNAKVELQTAAVEIQIVSSADAASHLVGPFFNLYWYENPSMPIEQILAENRRKLSVDWEKKVTLPEIRNAFRARHELALETAGMLPTQYLD